MVVCPYCGSVNYDSYGESYTETKYTEFCFCLDCDKHFNLVYELKEVKKVD